ncbi:tetraacyldisaccharide 4'-kinase [Gaetbulibacter saemankumensis]|uniref:tetraacyldisaccharide 4'-kinase n=1 Tax=Gaetbulibacter saemankumensis TaxID=311208 RepID=UPI000482BDE4|nr:tetraacyldisaccharide 4'-kinase [Gaetbulibacter saemankumensis]
MKLIRKISFPFVPLYYLATYLRNKMFDWGIKKSMRYEFPVICVGNLSVGGTGKTPMIEYLIQLLKDDYKIATLSRGYKRKSKGYQLASQQSDADQLGDEPFQFYNKFKEQVLVAVDADRAHGIELLRNNDIAPEVILLDDAFQHRRVSAGLNILLSTYYNLYTEDILLPTGNLREPKSGAKRADVIVVTKCPSNLSEKEKIQIIKSINPKTHQQVFFSSINYGAEVISDQDRLTLEVLKDLTLVTGIANASTLVDYLKGKGLKFNHLNFSDHHEFTSDEISELSKLELILTTEKDYMRLKQYESLRGKLYYLPITVQLDRPELFAKRILEFIEN